MGIRPSIAHCRQPVSFTESKPFIAPFPGGLVGRAKRTELGQTCPSPSGRIRLGIPPTRTRSRLPDSARLSHPHRKSYVVLMPQIFAEPLPGTRSTPPAIQRSFYAIQHIYPILFRVSYGWVRFTHLELFFTLKVVNSHGFSSRRSWQR